jgi:hypothetical protein
MGLAGLNPLVETYVKEEDMEEDMHAEGMHDKDKKWTKVYTKKRKRTRKLTKLSNWNKMM